MAIGARVRLRRSQYKADEDKQEFKRLMQKWDSDLGEPLVDSGMIQVAVAIAVLGFVFQAASDRFSDVSVGIYIVSGISCFLLYFVYFCQWVERHAKARIKAQMIGLPEAFIDRVVPPGELRFSLRVGRIAMGLKYWAYWVVFLAHTLLATVVGLTIIRVSLWALTGL